MRHGRLALALALAATPAAGCAPGVCTNVGCVGGVVVFEFSYDLLDGAQRPLVVAGCVGGVCATRDGETAGPGADDASVRLQGGRVVLEVPEERLTRGRKDASLTITDAGGRTVVAAPDLTAEITGHRPNGPRCGPVCLGGTVSVPGDG